jgi:hypothetical protein
MAGLSSRPIDVMLSLTICVCAIVLGVTLYRITCDEDADLAMLAMICRVAEGILGAAFIAARLAVRSVDAGTVDARTLEAIRVVLGRATGLNVLVSATLFAIGSTLFSYLLLRGRIVPAALAGFGLVASVLLVIGLPLQLGGVLTGTIATAMWLPMLAFEVPVAGWLIVKGAATPSRRLAA